MAKVWKRFRFLSKSGSINGAWIMTVWTFLMVVEFILACDHPGVLIMLEKTGHLQVQAYSVAFGFFMGYRGIKKAVAGFGKNHADHGNSGEPVD